MNMIEQALIIISFILVLGALAEFIYRRTGLPDVIWLVGAGILMGPVFKIVPVAVLQSAVPFFGAIALTIILSNGAYQMRIKDVKTIAPRGLLLGFSGFFFSMFATYLFLWAGAEMGWLKPHSPMIRLLVGSIVGGTSALIIMPTMSKASVDKSIVHTLEVESSSTDALCVVATMAMIDLVLHGGAAGVSQPLIVLCKQLGIGVGFGILAAALMIPAIPASLGKAHGYTLFLALVLALYAITSSQGGNGAMAVLTCALLVGNSADIVPLLIPGANPQAFGHSEVHDIMQEQMVFIIKSFFFLLIGLMFPTDWRQIVIGISGAAVLLLFRIPAVAVSTFGNKVSRADFWLMVVAMPRGLAAGVLASLPLQAGVPGVETLSSTIFSMIVTSIVVFSVGMMIAARRNASKEPAAAEPV